MPPRSAEVVYEAEARWLAFSGNWFQLWGNEKHLELESVVKDWLVTFQACVLLVRDQTLEETLAKSLVLLRFHVRMGEELEQIMLVMGFSKPHWGSWWHADFQKTEYAS